jgi:hypothetical protein
MHERKMGLAETPRWVSAIASVCRVFLLLQVDCIATEASRFVDNPCCTCSC